MFTAEQLTAMPWKDMVAFVKSAERALFPDAAVRSTARFWLELATIEYGESATSRDLDPERIARIKYMCNRAKPALIRLMDTRTAIAEQPEAMAETYGLKDALLAEDEAPFEKAFRQLHILMDIYTEQPPDSLEELMQGKRPKRPMPVDHPASMLARARCHTHRNDMKSAAASLGMIDRVVTLMVKNVVELR